MSTSIWYLISIRTHVKYPMLHDQLTNIIWKDVKKYGHAIRVAILPVKSE